MLDGHVLPHERRHWGTRRSRHRSDVAPVKRGGATFTWFHPGQGACGGHNGDSDFIVAISHLIWNNGAHCGDSITITYEGKSVQATVVDECMGCDSDHIDLSPGLLHHIAGPGTDMISDGSWSFGVLAPPSPSPKPKPTPTPPPPPPPPSTTSKARPTTTPTSTQSSTSTSSIAKTSSTASSSSASASATPAPTPYVDDGSVHNLIDINVLLINIGGVVADGLLAQA
ncbi:hypothetical protein P691DRAFT_812400 [Macrolepiota fuliginosa MF-IS2]|uniref:RlpA-like protein double-psi beta-barrel domain-containing protein n=1 Tax=Macrolepiota fuliginosa MF-IS2 TaxID=1400762 RepID=A0A9P6C6L9_9AGAR|nr:hypothetical protein P691DRAFT_812400 [Macrolepiota fuliginosa MF-IS2]